MMLTGTDMANVLARNSSGLTVEEIVVVETPVLKSVLKSVFISILKSIVLKSINYNYTCHLIAFTISS